MSTYRDDPRRMEKIFFINFLQPTAQPELMFKVYYPYSSLQDSVESAG